MTTPLRVLHLESNRHVSARIETMLTDGGIPCLIRRIESRAAFTSILTEGQVDLILAEFNLPWLDGPSALELARTLASDVPVIFVSTTLQGTQSIEQLDRGATDCIPQNELDRLVPSVRRVLREQQERAARARAEAALSESEAQFRQVQKLEAVGRLAGGLAHDFNNLLTVIMGQSQVLLSEMDQNDAFRSRVEEMHKAGERARILIRQLLTFSRKQPSEARVLSLNTVLADLEPMLGRLIGEDIRLTLRPSVDDLNVKTDPAWLEQVVMNLVVNAKDAMPKGGKLQIETTGVDLDHAPLYHIRPITPGAYVRLSVADSGCGMTPEVQSHMFEPFFTTKEEGKGTGLGLSTVFGIVTQSGGGLDVTSKIGEGTRFDVYLPRVETEVMVPSDENPAMPSRGGQETILLVEDDEDVRALIRDQLRKRGYRIVEARNGVEACLVATPYMRKLQLLLTDIVMPGMSGVELARNLLMIKPELSVLLISGYMDDVGVSASEPSWAYLQKPFTPEAVADKVREVLDLKSSTQKRRGHASAALPSSILK
ncbi:MAG: response regulator [Nitrospira sp.]|nr:response regulator [Nitrospira sp.]MDH4370919.1 response regulator [Nitrospira sp.]MDH5347132.1 response regulator [Nitrospira sp.]MDH5498530.1 response regulator [Nitrospira sp.]MDH5725219.1 response regulator [Nitrospira sp.]